MSTKFVLSNSSSIPPQKSWMRYKKLDMIKILKMTLPNILTLTMFSSNSRANEGLKFLFKDDITK